MKKYARRLNVKDSADLNEKIITFAEKGLLVKEIAAALGYDRPYIQSRMSRLIEVGRIGKAVVRKRRIEDPRFALKILGVRYAVTRGSILAIANQLTGAELEWLFKSTPDGTTVSESIALIIKAAFKKEKADG
jgi:hypothetical protein